MRALHVHEQVERRVRMFSNRGVRRARSYDGTWIFYWLFLELVVLVLLGSFWRMYSSFATEKERASARPPNIHEYQRLTPESLSKVCPSFLLQRKLAPYLVVWRFLLLWRNFILRLVVIGKLPCSWTFLLQRKLVLVVLIERNSLHIFLRQFLAQPT